MVRISPEIWWMREAFSARIFAVAGFRFAESCCNWELYMQTAASIWGQALDSPAPMMGNPHTIAYDTKRDEILVSN